MKFAHCTDIHYAQERASFRKNRISEQGLELVGGMLRNLDPQTDFLVNGGDLIQFEKSFDPSLDKIWMSAVRDAFHTSGLPTHYTIGNYDIERTGGIKAVGELLNAPHTSYHFDHTDKNGTAHRMILLNQEFQAVPDDQKLYPWSDDNLVFLEDALRTAPGRSVTIFAHSPCDDFDWQQANTAMRGFNVSNNFRPNSAELRGLMESSGKSILFMAGHTHIETNDQYKNVAYMTVQGMTEATSNGSEKPFGRWVSIHRDGEDTIRVQEHGYKAQSWSWDLKNGHYAKKSAPALDAHSSHDLPERSLGAE